MPTLAERDCRCEPPTNFTLSREDRPDAHAVPAGPLFRWLRRRRRLPLPGASARSNRSGIPTWLAQPAALVENSKLIDAPPHGPSSPRSSRRPRISTWSSCTPRRPRSTRTSQTIEALKAANPNLKAGLIGAKVAVEADKQHECRRRRRLRRPQRVRLHDQGSRRRPRLVADRGPQLSQRPGRDRPQRRPRRCWRTWTSLPFVTPVYKRDLKIENYFIGYLKHPYISIYTGRGCKSRCTFCLWPQTVGGHRYRTRSVEHVVEEIALGEEGLPAGQGVLLRRRHLHRRPAARRGDRRGARQARRHLVVQRQGQCARARR